MWRFWNSVPRFVRQQLHGPRASAGVYVEEEKSEHEVEKSPLTCSAQEQHGTAQEQGGATVKESEVFGCKWRRRQYHGCRYHAASKPDPKGADPQGESCHEQTNHGKGDFHGHHGPRIHGREEASEFPGHCHWWKHRCREQFWSQMWRQQHSLEAVTWGAAMVFGLQLSRKPELQKFFEAWKDPDKRQQWWNLLLRVAFSMPPDAAVSASRSIIHGPLPQKQDTEARFKEDTQKAQENVPDTVVPHQEDKKTLSDVMQEFESSCQKYTAVASSVSGVLAAEQGHAASAVQHLQLASRLGHAPAYFNLALCYEMGVGVEKDQKQAASYYKLAADVGHAQSIFNLALMTLRGEGGITQDRAKAIQLLNKAAKQGLVQAQTYLGVYYTEDDDNQQDFEQAAAFFKAAARQNDSEAQYFLGICYENGWGLESSDEEAARLYSAAAELGHDGALYNLAAFHEYGLGGIKRDEEEAMNLYRRAAEQGNENAKFRLDEEDARKAVRLWSEQDSKSGLEQSASLRRTSHSSSPVLSDYVHDSIAGIWSGELTAWFSSQSLHSSSKVTDDLRPTFVLGEHSSASSLGSADVETNNLLLDFSQQPLSMHQSYLPTLHRTSTMPELRMVSCQ